MAPDMCPLSDFKENRVNQNQKLANQCSQSHRRQRERNAELKESDRMTDKDQKVHPGELVSGGMLWYDQ